MAGATVEGAGNGLAAQATRIPALDADDLVSVMIGANDLLALQADVAAGRLTDIQAQAETGLLGIAVAQQVNALLATGARALVFTVPDLRLTPLARAANLARPGASALLSDLSARFNGLLRTGIDATRFDGRNVGLILVDEAVQAVAAAPPGSRPFWTRRPKWPTRPAPPPARWTASSATALPRPWCPAPWREATCGPTTGTSAPACTPWSASRWSIG